MLIEVTEPTKTVLIEVTKPAKIVLMSKMALIVVLLSVLKGAKCMRWKYIDESYLDWMRENYERRMPFSDYGENSFKPFFGNLFEFGDLVYVTQISSPKEKHIKLRKALDFYKIYNPSDNKFIAVVNLNYMFPVHKTLIEDVRYKNIDKYRSFKSDDEKSKYIDLLRLQLREINNFKLADAAEKIYRLKYEVPDSPLSLRSFDFKHLEKGCLKFMSNHSHNP